MRLDTPQLSLNNRYIILFRVIDNIFYCDLNNKDMLRKVTVKIGLERINTQEGITVEVLLDSSVTELVISLKFSKRQGFKFKKIERPIYIRNIDRIFNKEGPIGLTGRQKKGR